MNASDTTNSLVASAAARDPPVTTAPEVCSVIVIAPPLASFECEGFQSELFAWAQNLAVPVPKRRYYYMPLVRIATIAACPAASLGAGEDEKEEQTMRSTVPDIRVLPLVGGFHKVSLMVDFDPPGVRRMALLTLRDVLPSADAAAIDECNVRPLPIGKVGWSMADPLPLTQLGITFYHSRIPALTPGCPFPLELMVNSEAMARQLQHNFAQLALMVRLTFTARSVSFSAAAAAVDAHRAAAAAVHPDGGSSITRSVVIKTSHLVSSRAWRALWGLGQPREVPGACDSAATGLRPIKREPGSGAVLAGCVGADQNGHGALVGIWPTAVTHLLDFFASERMTFVAQLRDLVREFRREIGSQPTTRMIDGSAAAIKFEELTAKHLATATGREVVWESRPAMTNGSGVADQTDPLSQLISQPQLVQGVDVCPAAIEKVLSAFFRTVVSTDTTATETRGYLYQPDGASALVASGWAVWGGSDVFWRRKGMWTLEELQRDLWDECGVWVELCGDRLIPAKIEMVVLSLARLVPSGRDRDISCLHTAPIGAAAAFGKGPVFPDDRRRMHHSIRLTNPTKSEPWSVKSEPIKKQLKRRQSESRDQAAESVRDEDDEENECLVKRRRTSREEDQLRIAQLTAIVERLTMELEERENTTTTACPTTCLLDRAACDS